MPVNTPPPCFREGTKILTLRGEIAVEDLSNSDVVIGPSGEKVPVRWVGWRRLAIPASGPKREDLLPIRVSRGALADNVPKRDLYVSPGHALYLEGMLIPAVFLVNGTTVTQCDDVAMIVYYHVELAKHSVLLADGAPAESYLEFDDNRTFFANARGVTQLRAELPEAYRANLQWRLGRLVVPHWLWRLGRLVVPHWLVWPVKGVLSHLGAVHVFHGKNAVEKVRQQIAMRAEALAAERGVESELRKSA